MIKSIGQNNPCPCGSGKKYKDCCFNEEQTTNNIISLDNARQALEKFREVYNDTPQSGFLGLTPSQMNLLLYYPETDVSQIIVINSISETDDIKNVPIVKEALKFLELLTNKELAKATKKGNLSRKLILEYLKNFPEEYSVIFTKAPNEADIRKLALLRYLFMEMNLIIIDKNNFALTDLGKKALEADFTRNFFIKIFNTYCTEFTWCYQDGYPDLPIIQLSFLFSLYILREKAASPIDSMKLARIFLSAFPILIDTIDDDEMYVAEDAKSIIEEVFVLRFLVRFCHWFGLIRTNTELSSSLDSMHSLEISNSPLFKKMFSWKV